jgi:hypothetical protein
MRSVSAIVVGAALLAANAFQSSGAHAAPASLWDHNGSAMRLEEEGKKRRFVYEQPRDSLGPAGVKSGTVLFEGEEKKDGRLEGYAKLFRKGCDPIDYFVEGAYDKAKGEVLLQGQAPIYSGDGCKITGYTDDGSASSLRFSQLDAPSRDVASRDQTEPDAFAHEPAPYAAQDAEERLERLERQPGFEGPDTGERDPVYGRYWRDRASRRDRVYGYNRYDGAYDNGPAYRDDPYYDEDDDDDPDEDDEDPAYIPFEPFQERDPY